MTSIHAPIPPHLRDAVLEAKQRGEEPGSRPEYDAPERSAASRTSSVVTPVVTKNQAIPNPQEAARESNNSPSSITFSFVTLPESHEEDDDAKENEPSHLLLPVLLSHDSSRRHILGKRPLSELPTPIDPDALDTKTTGIDENAPTGQLPKVDNGLPSEPVKKSPKLDISARSLNTHGKLRQEDRPTLTKNGPVMIPPATDFGDDKENVEIVQRRTPNDVTKAATQQPVSHALEHLQRPTLRKVSNVGPSRSKGQARVGIRRL
jgi:ubiquitin-conjugating enzyme E2 S